ncbi:lipopolysaccharide-induced tumor necrosis factor-alpha factor homolog [Hoplias malabaricus]|uniref:lipopolysaccharide-induced tumor necrosis factor-alpha factor homolog n=1 Tax=Hoplias malabaricus TaxID=27720 RepID=UPI0034628D45
MDSPERAVQPPSYTEATQCPAYTTGPVPSTPPPSYVEAVSGSNDTAPIPYPILVIPSIPTEITTVQQTEQVRVQQTLPTAPRQAQSRRTNDQTRRRPQQGVRVRFWDKPTATLCPYCRERITTAVEYKPGATAWGVCCIFTILGFICGCCLIPFCSTAFQDVHHSCPRCNRHLGIFIR